MNFDDEIAKIGMNIMTRENKSLLLIANTDERLEKGVEMVTDVFKPLGATMYTTRHLYADIRLNEHVNMSPTLRKYAILGSMTELDMSMMIITCGDVITFTSTITTGSLDELWNMYKNASKFEKGYSDVYRYVREYAFAGQPAMSYASAVVEEKGYRIQTLMAIVDLRTQAIIDSHSINRATANKQANADSKSRWFQDWDRLRIGYPEMRKRTDEKKNKS
ncbi:hypothetical protein B0A54_17636 [Friedmanniomyces endolithicus]|uniref:Uncharacterized protein n=1 Tax=Friedmanniomyces endolithicus TaxID=329885 RepID=A0A4U0TWK1_9PEZI|nr:hypothetical protein LTS09_017444 [Friedmanniomyces endolithicus]TKA26225.1 hypothetical protein B0A54_17636 [Friedmanniomyces endolithicus]